MVEMMPDWLYMISGSACGRDDAWLAIHDTKAGVCQRSYLTSYIRFPVRCVAVLIPDWLYIISGPVCDRDNDCLAIHDIRTGVW